MSELYQTMIEQVRTYVSHDSRICGLALGGSYIYQTMDAYSDLDFIIVCDDQSYTDVLKDRMNIINRFGLLLDAFTGEHVNEPRLSIALYDNPMLHCDFKFISLCDFETRIENPAIIYEVDACLSRIIHDSNPTPPTTDLQWIEDRFWVWVHYATTKIQRGEYFEVIDFLAFLRRIVLGPMIQLKLGLMNKGVRKLEVDAPEYIIDLTHTLANHDKVSCTDALHNAIKMYCTLRKDLKSDALTVNILAQEKVYQYLNEIDA